MKKNFIIIFGLILFVFCFVVSNKHSIKNFLNATENRTFDIRQNISIHSKSNLKNSNIVIIAIDDASYEYILEKYGEWPLKRDIYAKLVDYIEYQKPKSIAFDLMFVKSMKSDSRSDIALVDIFKKYNNVFTAMNLDNQPEDLRIPENLPEKLSINVKSEKNLYPLEYSNCRTILPEIINTTPNIGMINVSRADDGVLRKMPLFLKYNNKYYPQLGLKVAMDYWGKKNTKELNINKSGILKIGNNKSINTTENGEVILNWYGGAGTFENIPLYKILKEIDKKNKSAYNFKDKIVYLGATASSLFDIKTVPTDKVYPGVEVQATYVSNLIDGLTIKKAPFTINLFITLLLAIFTVLIVYFLNSIFISLTSVTVIYIIYVILTYYVMRDFNTWLNIITPLSIAILTLFATLTTKYFIKSKDFDYQYKLATTDGLTELYNHRYFQEQMKRYVVHSQRYNENFSLIIIDIDFFKKFNDNFGHQSGDAVLKQVSLELKKNVRGSDIVCRYGGEEMGIILPNTNFEEGTNIAQKLCTIIAAKKFKLSNQRESNVTISLGVSTFPQDGQTPYELIDKADTRLYNAKENGRNRVN